MTQESSTRNRQPAAYSLVLSQEPPPCGPGAAGVPTRLLWTRLRVKLSLREAAGRASMNFSMLSRLEHGRAELTVSQAERLGAAYRVRPVWLAFGDGPVEEKST